MNSEIRPRRSVLYMPGSNPRALEKARTLPADGLIFDLEDAVAPGDKESARQLILEALRQGGYGGREILVRVNGLDTPWGKDDLAAAAKSGAHGVLLPKVESAAEVREAEALLPGNQAIWCMMETPKGILRAEEIGGSSPRLGGLVMGTSDLAKDLHAAHTAMRLPMLVSLGQCLLAARAYGIAILDGVHLDLEDEAGFRASCHQGRELGFDGKTLIHPKTIDAANEIFGPSPSELDWAKKIIAAYEAANSGVTLVEGKLVEQLHVDAARRLLVLADRIAAPTV